jgi:hypothetical protein
MFSSPDFMVVGPKKTGTSWLYEQFRLIKGISVPPFKELSFFYDADEWSKVQSDRKLLRFYDRIKKSGAGIPANIAEKDARLRIKHIKQSQKEKRRRNFLLTWKGRKYLWSIFFYLIPRGFSRFHLYLYTLLFRKSAGEMAGDISPEYF